MKRKEVKQYIKSHVLCSDLERPDFFVSLVNDPVRKFKCEDFDCKSSGIRGRGSKLWALYRRELTWRYQGKDITVSDYVVVFGFLYPTKDKEKTATFTRETEIPDLDPNDSTVDEKIREWLSTIGHIKDKKNHGKSDKKA